MTQFPYSSLTAILVPMTTNEKATQYAERVCNGQFPITYSREQVVKHTADDYQAGWDESIETNKPDWFKAGGMAERILIDWEMKQLKSKLNDVTCHYAKSVLSCDALQQENNELKSKQNALEQRIKMLVEKAECQNRC